MEISPIAFFSSPFKTKFGIPRQSGIVEDVVGAWCSTYSAQISSGLVKLLYPDGKMTVEPLKQTADSATTPTRRDISIPFLSRYAPRAWEAMRG